MVNRPPGSGHDSPVSPGSVGAGFSVGTLVAFLANLLPPDNALRQFLILAAPGISVAVSSLWVATKAQWHKRQQRLEVAEQERVLDETLLSALATIEELLQDPVLTLQQREELYGERWELIMLKVRYDRERSQALITRRLR